MVVFFFFFRNRKWKRTWAHEALTWSYTVIFNNAMIPFFVFFLKQKMKKDLSCLRLWHNLTLTTNSAIIKLIWLFWFFCETQREKHHEEQCSDQLTQTHRGFILLFKQVFNFFYTSCSAILQPHALQIFGFLEYWH